MGKMRTMFVIINWEINREEPDGDRGKCGVRIRTTGQISDSGSGEDRTVVKDEE